jgi:hypothetical protein
MSLSKILQAGVDTLFTVMKDKVITAQYRSYDDYTGDDFDTQTQQVEKPYKEYPIKGILTEFSKKDMFEAHGRIVIDDKKFIVKYNSINRELFTGDLIIIGDIEYSIIDLKKELLTFCSYERFD